MLLCVYFYSELRICTSFLLPTCVTHVSICIFIYSDIHFISIFTLIFVFVYVLYVYMLHSYIWACLHVIGVLYVGPFACLCICMSSVFMYFHICIFASRCIYLLMCVFLFLNIYMFMCVCARVYTFVVYACTFPCLYTLMF